MPLDRHIINNTKLEECICFFEEKIGEKSDLLAIEEDEEDCIRINLAQRGDKSDRLIDFHG